MKQKVVLLIKSFFVAVAMTTEFNVGLKPEFYETKIDYIIASIYELLGRYNVTFLFIWFSGSAYLCTLLLKKNMKQLEAISQE